MKHIIIILISLCITPFFAVGQEVFQGYKITCERVLGCAINNNGKTPQEYCPTCSIIKTRTEKNDYVAWGEKVKEELRYLWDENYFKNDSPKKEPSGWGWDGPTRYGLRVPYN